ncbi:MAG: Ig-like domain-containing protein, partial [Ignavibacteriaceae bacterium]
IKITNPEITDWINEGSNVIISSESPDKNIAKVEFFGDGKSLGYCTTAPFSWVWFNIPKGKHEIKVTATDFNGNKNSSKSINVFVHKN